MNKPETRFDLGQIIITEGAVKAFRDAFGEDRIKESTERVLKHGQGDWGELTTDDKRRNDDNLRHNTQNANSTLWVLSVWTIPKCQDAIWILTEDTGMGRVTTILLNSEY